MITQTKPSDRSGGVRELVREQARQVAHSISELLLESSDGNRFNLETELFALAMIALDEQHAAGQGERKPAAFVPARDPLTGERIYERAPVAAPPAQPMSKDTHTGSECAECGRTNGTHRLGCLTPYKQPDPTGVTEASCGNSLAHREECALFPAQCALHSPEPETPPAPAEQALAAIEFAARADNGPPTMHINKQMLRQWLGPIRAELSQVESLKQASAELATQYEGERRALADALAQVEALKTGKLEAERLAAALSVASKKLEAQLRVAVDDCAFAVTGRDAALAEAESLRETCRKWERTLKITGFPTAEDRAAEALQDQLPTGSAPSLETLRDAAARGAALGERSIALNPRSFERMIGGIDALLKRVSRLQSAEEGGGSS